MTWTEAFTLARTNLLKTNGQGGVGRSGLPVPKMTPWEAMELASQIVPDAIRAVEKSGIGHAAVDPSAEASLQAFEMLADQGRPDDFFAASPELAAATGSDTRPWRQRASITVADWLVKGYRIPNSITVRMVPVSVAMTGEGAKAWHGAQTDLQKLAPAGVAYRAGKEDGDNAVLDHVVGAWNELMHQTADAIATALIHPQMSAASLQSWWSAYYGMMMAIETVISLPDETTWERIKGGLKHSGQATLDFVANDVAEAAGQAVAVIATTAGKAVGSATLGFFDQAGLTALLVTAVAVYVVLLR